MESIRFVTCAEAVERSGESARQAFALLIDAVAVSRRAHLRGKSLDDVVRGLTGPGDQVRRKADRAIQEYEHAVMTFRSELMRVLVDEMSLTLTAAANEMGVARQTASRLYQVARDQDEG